MAYTKPLNLLDLSFVLMETRQTPMHVAGLQVFLPGSTTAVPACGEAPAGNSKFEVWGQFKDLYYWNFSLTAHS